MGSDPIVLANEIIPVVISIHAPRVGSDLSYGGGGGFQPDFNPRSPCGERQLNRHRQFGISNFNPRSPCGERPAHPVLLARLLYFNPRSPCGERLPSSSSFFVYANFNPRSPCGERLFCGIFTFPTVPISIHAPRVGSDNSFQCCQQSRFDFNPRSPCGERLAACCRDPDVLHFNPRSPCGERLAKNGGQHRLQTFQSTLPVWGATHGKPRKQA